MQACGSDPGWWCEHIERWTGSDSLASGVEWFFHRPLRVALIVVVAVLVRRLAGRTVDRLSDRTRKLTLDGHVHDAEVDREDGERRALARSETVRSVLGSLLTVAVWVTALLLVLGEFDVDLGPLLAGAGVVGIAVGFGAQSLVRDVLAGLFVLIEDQYGVGDTVDLGEAEGVVERLTLRSTRLRDTAGTVWVVPNGAVVRSGNRSRRFSRAVVDVTVANDADVVAAEAAARSAIAALASDETWATRLRGVPEYLGIQSLDPSGTTIRVVAETAPAEQWAVERELRRRIRAELAELGVRLPEVSRVLPNDPPPPSSAP